MSNKTDDVFQYSEHRPTFSREERDRRWGVVRERMADRGIDCAVRRVSGRAPAYEGELLSTNAIIDRILDQRG